MPDNRQARIDDMPPDKKSSHRGLITFILVAIAIEIFVVIAFG